MTFGSLKAFEGGGCWALISGESATPITAAVAPARNDRRSMPFLGRSSLQLSSMHMFLTSWWSMGLLLPECEPRVKFESDPFTVRHIVWFRFPVAWSPAIQFVPFGEVAA